MTTASTTLNSLQSVSILCVTTGFTRWPVVNVLGCYSRGRAFNPSQGGNLICHFCSTCAPSQFSYDKQYTYLCCWWDDGRVRERTGHQTSYVEDKKIKSLTLHDTRCYYAQDCRLLV